MGVMFIAAAVSAAAQTHNISFPPRQRLEAIFARTKFHLDAFLLANLQCFSIKKRKERNRCHKHLIFLDAPRPVSPQLTLADFYSIVSLDHVQRLYHVMTGGK